MFQPTTDLLLSFFTFFLDASNRNRQGKQAKEKNFSMAILYNTGMRDWLCPELSERLENFSEEKEVIAEFLLAHLKASVKELEETLQCFIH